MTLQQTSTPALRRPAARRDKQRLWQEMAMIAPAVLLLTIFLITPFLLSFWTAMTNQPLVPRPTPVRFVGLLNFERVFTDPLFWTSLWNVTRFTFWVLPVQCGLAFLTALLLHQKLPMQNLLRSSGRPLHAHPETGQVRFTMWLKSVAGAQSGVQHVA